MGSWNFLTHHARVLLCIAHDPGVRMRDIATALGVTERSAYGFVTDLAEAGYVVKEKDGRRNRYHIQAHLPLRDPISQERTIGEVLGLLVDANASSEGEEVIVESESVADPVVRAIETPGCPVSGRVRAPGGSVAR